MFSLDHYDLGTPPSQATESVALEIDGCAVTVPAGTSVMRAAAIARTQIPKLCATDTLKAFGSCRLCLVEIEGRKGYPASCTTEVAQGMKVKTQSETLERLRRGVMELYLSDHPAELVSDQAPVRTEIRAMAQRVGCTQNRYGADGARHLGAAVDDSNPYFQFDPNACIVCSRCVRACDEVQGTFALTIEGRGFASRVVASQNESFVASECVSCGACIEACPTTALQEKTLVARSVPDRAVTTTCAYCGVGCSFKAEMKGETVVRMAPDRDGKANHGHACVKGRFAYGYATHEDRVRTPLVRAKITDPWREVSWDEAIQYAASEFKRLQATYGRDSVGGITSSRCTNEEAYLVQKLVRAAFHNNNVDTCARVCHSPTGYGLKHTLGESGVHFPREDGCRSPDRSESDRGSSGLCLATETEAASRRTSHRRGSAHHRDRARAPRTGGLPPAAASRNERRAHERAGARRRDRGTHARVLHCRALRAAVVSEVESFRCAS